MMPSTVITAFGAADTIINRDETSVVNTTAQLAAMAASLTESTTPAAAATAIIAGEAAALTGTTALISDVQNNKSGLALLADTITVLGDVGMVVGAVVSQINTPQAKILATSISEIGDLAT
jgi:hypothetical protein